MTNAFSSMGYPHWLIVAGTVLLVSFIGTALRQRAAPPELEEMATVEEGRPSLRSTSLRRRPPIGRQGLQEHTIERWANKDRSAEEPLNDRPKV